jgi:hypothetical protein
MKKEQVEIISIIIGLVVQYGVPAVIAGIGALGKEEVTLDDIKALKDLIKPPEDY